MSETADSGSSPNEPREVGTSLSVDGVAVEKSATLYGEGAVAVFLTFRSYRDDRCTVRLTDELPGALRDSEVEFHPHYDPLNWTDGDDSVVYSTSLEPGESRTTAYGIVVDQREQLELFDADPAVDVVADRSLSDDGAGSPAAVSAEESAFDFGLSAGAGAGADSESASESEPSGTSPGRDEADAAPGASGSEPAAEGSYVAVLVDELGRRELTPDERAALRGALGLDDRPAVDDQLQSLREEVESLREELVTSQRESVAADRVETVSRELRERYRDLAADLEALEETVEREVRWRTQLRQQLRSDPADEAAPAPEDRAPEDDPEP